MKDIQVDAAKPAKSHRKGGGRKPEKLVRKVQSPVWEVSGHVNVPGPDLMMQHQQEDVIHGSTTQLKNYFYTSLIHFRL